MSFSKIRAGGFGSNATLASAELTAWDTDHANSLDKTGDTFPLGATINWASGSAQVVLSGASFTTMTGSTATIGGNTTFQNDALWNNNSRIVIGGITLQSQAGVDSTIANVNLKTTGTGRVVMGSNDYPVLGATHTGITQKVLYPISALNAYASGWIQIDNAFGTGLIGPGTSSGAGVSSRIIVPPMWNGATISNIDVLFNVNTGHASLPATFPGALLQYKVPTVGAAAPVWQTQGTIVNYPTEPVATYNNGQTKRLTMSIGTPVVARDVNMYAMQLTDEGGGGTVGVGSVCFQAIVVTYTIADLRPA